MKAKNKSSKTNKSKKKNNSKKINYTTINVSVDTRNKLSEIKHNSKFKSFEELFKNTLLK